MTPPRQALSVRQPWAWAIIHGGKDIENRSVFAISKGEMRAGVRVAIHAGKGMTREEYNEGADTMATRGVVCPDPHQLVRGAIIGSVFVSAIVSANNSLWFFGPRGLVLRDPEPCDPVPAGGYLGYFDWKPSGGTIEVPARWMLSNGDVAKPARDAGAAPDLFGETR